MTTERLDPNDVAAYDAELARLTVDGAPRSLGGRNADANGDVVRETMARAEAASAAEDG
jgi:hypothetical protein